MAPNCGSSKPSNSVSPTQPIPSYTGDAQLAGCREGPAAITLPGFGPSVPLLAMARMLGPQCDDAKLVGTKKTVQRDQRGRRTTIPCDGALKMGW